MAIEFHQPLAQSNQFSTIVYPATPKLKFDELCLQSKFTKSPTMLFTQSGRTALAIAGQQLKQLTNIILVPTYHCPAAIEPFIWLDYQCVFYRINADLSPDINHIKQLLEQHNITHCLIINYFGLAYYLPLLIELMQARGIFVIHDCAHALFKALETTTAIYQPDATICSINKLLPTIDGGILVLKTNNKKVLNIVPKWPELKAISYFLGITDIINKLRHYLPARTDNSNNHPPSTATKFRYFLPKQVEQRCFSHTISLLSHTNLALVRQKRRNNYLYLLALLDDPCITSGHALFNQLAADDVPYVLPYLLNNPKYFKRLRQAGIQSLRWEELAKTNCDISNQYRHCLVQLPCHHQLTKRDLRIMVQKIKEL